MKKIQCLIKVLLLTIIFSICGATDAFSYWVQTEKDGINYSIDPDNKIATVRSGDYKGSFIIPEKITLDSNGDFNGVYTVTSVVDGCFAYLKGLTSVTLPNSITSLGDNCFAYCQDLYQVVLPNGITSLGDNCFLNCKSLHYIHLPNSITSLGNGCFAYCSFLFNITLPNNIKILSRDCFNGTSLQDIEIPEGVTTIQPFCFANCNALSKMILPSTLEKCYENVWGQDGNNNKRITCFSTLPPEAADDFIGTGCKLYVPTESIEKYKSTSPWNKAKIFPMNFDQEKVTSLSQIEAGCAIKIYPYDHFGEIDVALACSGDGQELTSYEKTGSGDIWTLVDAGDGCYYLKNDLGCYWAYQGISSGNSLSCTTDESKAERVKLSWSSKYNGLCFWSLSGYGLNNLNGIDLKYNWWSDAQNYESDPNSTFEIFRVISVEEIKIDESNVPIELGKSHKLNVTVTPENATKKAVIWSSSDETVATVAEDGTVLAIAEGEADITAEAADGSGVKAVCHIISVRPRMSHLEQIGPGCVIKIYPYGHYGERNMALACSGNRKELTSYQQAGSGDTWTLVDAGGVYYYLKNELGCYWTCNNNDDRFNPTTCTTDESMAAKVKLSWSSRYNGLCFWNESDLGLTKAVSGRGYNWWTTQDNYEDNSFSTFEIFIEGKIVIPVEGIKFEESNITIYGGSSHKLNVIFNPENAINKKLTWTSDNTSVATVDSEGNVYGVSEGAAVITAKTTDGSDLTINCEVTVKHTKVTDINQLTPGCVIKIYPRDYNTVYYGDDKMALACAGDGQNLTSYENAGAGDTWTLVDAGGGYYYLKNNLGCYWQNSYTSIKCTTNESNACKVNLVWNSIVNGVRFFNSSGNLYNYEGSTYKWYEGVTICDILLIKKGDSHVKRINVDGIEYLLDLDNKTATVIRPVSGGYSGDIVIPETVTDEETAYTITSLGEECFSGYNITSLSLPNSVTSLPKGCFKYSGFTSFTVPEGVTSLGEECFWNCRSLTNITLPKGIKTLGNECFAGCTGLTNITLPEGVTSLGYGCFDFCTSLMNVTLPEGVTSLGNMCFYGCTSLTNITLPEGPTSLSESCFYGCTSLTNITLPEGLVSLGSSCFRSSGLKSIVLPSTLSVLGQNLFGDIENNILISCKAINPPSSFYDLDLPENYIRNNDRVFVPSEALEKYKNSRIWKNAYSINPLDPVASISLADGTTVERTKTTILDYSVLPESAGTKTLSWSSSNPDIASVDEKTGVVKGNKEGTATITATTTDGTDITASTVVTVLPHAVEPIDFVESNISVIKTKTATVTLTLSPEEAADNTIVWTSSDESVAIVEQDMNATDPIKAIVTAKKVGKAIIKAEVQDGTDRSATCEVEVTPLLVTDFTTQTTSVVRTKSVEMEITITPDEADNKTLTWTSLTPDIASVTEDGIVTGLKVGTAQLKAETTDGSDISKTFDVNVTGLPVNSISLPSELSIVKTESQKLECTVQPAEADNQTMNWTSDDESVATVTEDGVVTAVSVGTANITATTTDGSGISATCKVTVTPLLVSSITLNQTEAEIKLDETLQLVATVNPDEADNKDVIWSSSDKNIVSVTEDGTVLAIAEGEADITAEAADGSGVKAVCHVTVVIPVKEIMFEESSVTIEPGEVRKLNVTVTPENATNKEVIWSSSDETVVTVEYGYVTAIAEGEADITAEAVDGSGVKAVCHITVAKPDGISNITMGDVKIVLNKRHLSVVGLADNDVIQITNYSGFNVYKGTKHEIDLNADGIYIVKVKGQTLKIQVK